MHKKFPNIQNHINNTNISSNNSLKIVPPTSIVTNLQQKKEKTYLKIMDTQNNQFVLYQKKTQEIIHIKN